MKDNDTRPRDRYMGFRFQKRFKVIPGVSLNLSKSGISWSFGPRGAKINVRSNGKKTVSLGIPGTGLSYRRPISSSASDAGDASVGYVPPSNQRLAVKGVAVLLVAALLLVVLASSLGGPSRKDLVKANCYAQFGEDRPSTLFDEVVRTPTGYQYKGMVPSRYSNQVLHNFSSSGVAFVCMTDAEGHVSSVDCAGCEALR